MCICCFWLVLLGVFFSPFLLLFALRRVYVLLLFLSCLTVLRKERSFFFPPRLSFCCFYGVTPLSWSRYIHTFRTSTTTTKRVIQIGEQELREREKKKHLCWRLWLRRDADSTSLSTAHRRRWRTSLDLRVSAYRRMHQFLFFYGWLVRNLVLGKEKKKNWVITYELYTSEVTLLCFLFNTILLLVQFTVFFLTFLVFFFFPRY